VREDQRRPPGAGDDVRHGEGLAGAGNAEQGLECLAVAQPFEQCADSRRLVAGRGELAFEVVVGGLHGGIVAGMAERAGRCAALDLRRGSG